MDNIKPIIAKNISNLRQAKGMTQNDLAKELNYSDKAVSKWERAESIPDIVVLKQISDLFGVSLDYLVEEKHDPKKLRREKLYRTSVLRTHGFITGMSILLVWLIATILFVVISLCSHAINYSTIALCSYAVPISMIVWLILNSIWFNLRRNYLIISLLMWSLLLCIFISIVPAGIQYALILTLGIPGQFIIMMWSALKTRKSKE